MCWEKNGQLLDFGSLNGNVSGNLLPQKFFLVFYFEAEKNRSRNVFFSGERETKQLCVGEERSAFFFCSYQQANEKLGFSLKEKFSLLGVNITSLFFSSVYLSKVLPFT